MDDPLDIDTGESIAELAELAEEPAPGFARRLWARIERRRLGSELAELTWQGILAVVVEYLEIVFEVFNVQESPTESVDGDKGELS